MKKITYVFLVCSAFFTGCIPLEEGVAPKTQLQVREVQTREFDTTDTRLVMKSMMHVLQDEGFIIKNAVLDLGLLSAEKNIDLGDCYFPTFKMAFKRFEEQNKKRHETSFGWDDAAKEGPRWDKLEVLEASANVSEYGSKTRVRMTFQRKTVDNKGCVSKVVTVSDLNYYQNFFEKVSKGIFIQEQGI